MLLCVPALMMHLKLYRESLQAVLAEIIFDTDLCIGLVTIIDEPTECGS